MRWQKIWFKQNVFIHLLWSIEFVFVLLYLDTAVNNLIIDNNLLIVIKTYHCYV